MGRHLSHRMSGHPTRPILARYQSTPPRHPSRPRTKTRTHALLARRTIQWTPRKRRNDQKNKQGILLARRESMDHRIHQRLRNLPTEQKPDPSYQNSTIPHPFRHQCQTVFTHSHGPHHGLTQERWFRRNFNHSRPWLFTRHNIPSLHHHNYRSRHSKTLPRKRIPMVRTSP
jgi:hypothetical protein